MISDEELAAALNIPVELVAKIALAKRAAYERMIEITERLRRGERPPGVIVCEPRR